MISLFEELVRTVVSPELNAAQHVGFLPPNNTWRDLVDGDPLLNVYLVDLRENRKLRSSAGDAPARIDCHYLISAWYSRTTTLAPGGGTSSSRQEADLLYRVAKRILAAAPFVPSARLSDVVEWDPHQDHEIPISLIPPEGFPKLPEFWGTIGNTDNLWKPVLHMVATLPLALPRPEPGPPVVKIIAHLSADGSYAESRVIITGTVTDAAGDAVADARVSLAHSGRITHSTRTEPDGRFVLAGIPIGSYRLVAIHDGATATIDLNPGSADPTYNVQLT